MHMLSRNVFLTQILKPSFGIPKGAPRVFLKLFLMFAGPSTFKSQQGICIISRTFNQEETAVSSQNGNLAAINKV